MRQALLTISAGLLFAAGASALAENGATALASTGSESGVLARSLAGWPELAPRGEAAHPAGELTQMAINQIIRIGPRSSLRRPWKCTVTLHGNVYYSEGTTETGTRTKLGAYTDQYAYCRRERWRG